MIRTKYNIRGDYNKYSEWQCYIIKIREEVIRGANTEYCNIVSGDISLG
jgi:hypothetical protein